ncbi:MAG: hypothetical protein Q9226_006807, partial [Calogaya cf. arnoldii]
VVGEETFRLCLEVVDEIIEVTTDETCAAIKDVFEDTRSIVEPAGALALAGLKKYVASHPSPDPRRSLVAIASGANMNFDRLRFVTERAALGENKEVLLSVNIPERPGAFAELVKTVLPHAVTEFSYRYSKEQSANIFMGISVNASARAEQLSDLIERLGHNGMKAEDLSGDELAKSHIRYLVGGRSDVADERLYMFEFPERPGSLIKFLTTLQPGQNISLFHYRNHGGDVGKILAGIQCPMDQKTQLDGFLKELGYPFSDCTDSAVYRMFLRDEQDVTYAFTNRTPQMRLTRAAFRWLQEQIDKLANISLDPSELEYLRNTCTYFNDAYLRFLTSFRLQPSKQVNAAFTLLDDTGRQDDVGNLSLGISGRWLDTILYEIPLLALTSEAYFKFCDKDWTYRHQQDQAYRKGCRLIEHGCIFSEFGSRRRRDYHTQDLVIQGLKRAAADGQAQGWKGKLSGTSNVHFAMKYGLTPVGTVAHEWFMGIASITNDYVHANETALRYWVGCFGEGVLGIALTDTFGTPTFLKAFKRTMPTPANSMADDKTTLIPGAASPPLPPMDVNGTTDTSEERSYAQIFQGVRQDSGNPVEFVRMMRDFYDSEDIHEKKTIVFSDSLNIELCLKYMQVAEEAGFAPTFGVGTFLTNDFVHESNGQKSVPLNIVIKLSSANGHAAIKISDNIGKNTGDSETVHKVKETLGYVEKQWANGNEATRWGASDDESTKANVQEK